MPESFPAPQDCAVCSRPLNFTAGHGWSHEDADHVAVPVARGAVATTYPCDGCGTATVRPWTLPASSFEMTPFGVTSVGDWAFCDVCVDLVQRGDWDALAGRTAKARSIPAQMMRETYRLLEANVLGQPFQAE